MEVKDLQTGNAPEIKQKLTITLEYLGETDTIELIKEIIMDKTEGQILYEK